MGVSAGSGYRWQTGLCFHGFRNRGGFQNDKLVYTVSAYSTAEAINQDPELILQVRALIEQHLEDGEYGVEQLAHDLCMERTGLYKS